MMRQRIPMPQDMRIAFQGEPGAYSEAAALTYAPGSGVLASRSFEEVFAAVADGRATHGILPMENTIGGSIHRNYDLLLERDLPIVGEVELHVDHCLLAAPGTRIEDVKVVYSHPQALAQCERALAQMRGVEVVAVYDTAGAAKMVREGGRTDGAAVASRRAGEVFGLQVLRESIQDFKDNITRFFIISPSAADVTGADKTSIVFSLESTPGAIFKALAPFALRDINLSKLESRPLRGRAWEYLFYLDIGLARDTPVCERALADLGEFTRWVRTLGSYPSWKSRSAAGPAQART
jgi:prephenate dehydratase